MVVSITKDKMILWSITGIEGTLPRRRRCSRAPATTATRATARTCARAATAATRSSAARRRARTTRPAPTPVFDYRGLSNALYEIANRHYNGKNRKLETYQIILMADGTIPYETIASAMAAMRCKIAEFGKEPKPLRAPDRGRRRAQAHAREEDLGRRRITRVLDTDARRVRSGQDGAVQRHPVLARGSSDAGSRSAKRAAIIRKAVERVPEGE